MEISRELYERVANMTGWDYEPMYQKEAEAPVILTRIKLEGMLEDLLLEISEREEKLEDTIKERDENWVRLPISSQVEITDKDFM
jgi:hypothetical protein